MKLHRFVPLLLVALALLAGIASPSLAAPGEAAPHVKVIAGGEPLKLDLDTLKLGESRQVTTESGKLVVVTRDDQGYLLSVDGKEIRLDAIDGDAHVKVITAGTEGGDGTQVFVRKEVRKVVVDSGEGGDKEVVKVIRLHGQGEGGEWETEAGEHVELGEGHGFHFITSEHGPEHILVKGCDEAEGSDCQVRVLRLGGDGEKVEVEVDGERKVIVLGPEHGEAKDGVKVWVDGGGERVIVLERREKKEDGGDEGGGGR